ncbi:MAG: hypothetical protein K6E19_05455 [Lachnospiraceae bacterium]|nr:hypothetical protein [Lachnospiraceae bacterium]
MADQERDIELANEKKQIKDEKKRLRDEEKKQKQEIKKRAKEISKRENEIADEEEPGGISSFVVTIVIVLVWIAILCFLIKLDVGGFGSEILTPLLKDVPVVNLILPGDRNSAEPGQDESYEGYNSIQEAVEYIKVLELELEHAQSVNGTYTDELTKLQAEVDRLREFEKMQVEFQRIKEQFYEEIIYADNAPDPEEYRKYYESIDPTTAEALYKQVVQRLEESKEIQDYAAAYSVMKPKQAAAIFEAMPNDLKLAARILQVMDSDTRGKILGAMDSSVAAQLTKIMDPER